MAAILRNGKKGVSLAYVIIAAMVLLVLSGVLAAAAGRNMGLTAVSTQSRQAYLTVKSAVEFAKGEAYRRAQAGETDDFSVRPDGDLFKAGEAKGKPDGKTVYALCTMKADGLVTVSGKVSYGSAGRSRSLGCSFRLTEDEEPVSGVGVINGYVAAGQRYGSTQYLNGNESNYELKGASLAFPVVMKKKISSPSQPFTAPEMYFLNSDESLFYKGGGTWQTFLKADVLCFSGAIRSESTPLNGKVLLYRYGKLSKGIICFLNDTEIRTAGGSMIIPEGTYYFQEGANLMQLHVGGASDKNALTEVSEKDASYREFKPRISYFTENADAIVSSEDFGGVGWTSDGCMQMNHDVGAEPDKDVFMYVEDSSNGNWRNNRRTPETFEARSIVLQYHSGGSSPFTFPAYNNVYDARQKIVTFRTDALWMNAQKSNGSPDQSGDKLVVRQGASDGQFILESLDGSSPVTFYLPHGLTVQNSVGGVLYAFDTGTYTVESGTNLFGKSAESAFTKISSEIGGGSGGGSGGDGVTAENLKYTDS